MPADTPPNAARANPSPARRAPTPPAKGPVKLDAWVLLAALRRHWLLAAVVSTLLAGAAGASVWFFLPPGHHTVTRVLHVSAAPQPVLDPQQRAGADFHTFKQTQVALLRSRIVLNAALRSPKVADSEWVKHTPEPLEWLERNVRVSFPASSEIMHVSLSGPAEEVPILTALVDAVADAYLSEIVDKDHQRTLKRHEQLREIAGRYEKKVKAIRGSMKKLREQAGTTDPKNLQLKQKLVLREHELAVQELSRHRSEIRSLRAQVKQHGSKGQVADGAAERAAELQKALAADATLAQMKREAARLDGLIESEADKSPHGREAPVVQPLLRKLKGQQAEIKKREDEIRKAVTDQSQQQQKRNADLGLGGMEQRLDYLKGLEKLLEADCERLEKAGRQLTTNALDLEEYTDILNEADTMRVALVKKAELLAIEAEAPPRISRLDQEAVHNVPDELVRKIRFGALAAAAAVGLSLLGICLLELRTQRVTSTAVANTVGLPLVGVLPFYRANKGGARAAARLKEGVDDARTMLLHQAEGKGLKALIVTSAVPGEGKTSLACHLAASLARAGRRTLLIDADLRKPRAHEVFGLPNVSGLCEVFRGEMPLSESVLDVGLPGLRMLPAGRCDDRALRSIAQNSFADALAQLRQEYDFIIIDSSPVLQVPDALMLGRHADGILFAVLLGESRTHCLASAAERFARMDAPILGLVVNGATDRRGEKYGKYAYPALPAAHPAT